MEYRIRLGIPEMQDFWEDLKTKAYRKITLSQMGDKIDPETEQLLQ